MSRGCPPGVRPDRHIELAHPAQRPPASPRVSKPELPNQPGEPGIVAIPRPLIAAPAMTSAPGRRL